MPYTIDRALPGDAETLARIQIESWKAAFADILSPDILENCTQLNKVTAMYQRMLDQNIGHSYLMKVDGQPHCIAHWNAARAQDMPGYAELFCIHSLPNRWHSGFGTQMMQRVLQDVAASDHSKVMLWVFEKNLRARRFYESQGFKTFGKKKPGVFPTEICYERAL